MRREQSGSGTRLFGAGIGRCCPTFMVRYGTLLAETGTPERDQSRTSESQRSGDWATFCTVGAR
jgi:hypothetical protein